jgi:tRNA U34 2-thiouridine synthase MnmA/TrmU
MIKKEPGIKELVSVTARPMAVPDRFKQAADFKALVRIKGFVLDFPKGSTEFTILDGQTITIKSGMGAEYELGFDAAKKQMIIACANDLQIVGLKEGERIGIGLDMFGTVHGEIEFSSITSPK